jgi:hypothetical protein
MLAQGFTVEFLAEPVRDGLVVAAECIVAGRQEYEVAVIRTTARSLESVSLDPRRPRAMALACRV